jgi:hypothetical protein
MGTRGLWGFVLDGEEKLTYNHFDSYPDGLGNTLIAYCRSVFELDGGEAELCKEVRKLKLVNEDAKPTKAQQRKLAAAGFHDPNVSTGSTEEWYSLLRNTQGDPRATLRSGFMIDKRDFALDSTFCEWAYVIDLDTGAFEVYQGFQYEPHEDGRFTTPEWRVRSAEQYAEQVKWFASRPRSFSRIHITERSYPVRLVATFPLYDLPKDLSALAQEDDE